MPEKIGKEAKKPTKPSTAQRKLDELSMLLKEQAFAKIAGAKESYEKTRRDFASHVKARTARLDTISTQRLREATKCIASLTRRETKGNPSPNTQQITSIFPADPCAVEFDATELSLRSSRGTNIRNFYKVLIFNHPFKTSFIRNGWYVGQILRFRQEWRPAGFSLGELVQSFSLAPGEKTTIEVSTWEKTRQEIEEIQAIDERKKEEEASKSTDSKQITESSKEMFQWHVDTKAEVGFGFGSASVEAGASGSSEQQASSTRSSVNEQSRAAASEISRSRSLKVNISKESGSEQRTVRTLENTNRCHSVTFTMFQLLKRHDLVMTYIDSPLCLIFPYAEIGLTSPTIQTMYMRLAEGLKDVRSIYNIISHYMQPNPSVAAFLSNSSRIPLGLDPAPFGEKVTVMEFPTYDPNAIVEGLTYFFGMVFDNAWNPPVDFATWDDLLANWMASETNIRNSEIAQGDQIVDTVEILTQALYMDVMLGKCSACEDFIVLSRSNEALRDFEVARRAQLENELLQKEIARRQARLDQGLLEPFEPAPPPEEEHEEGGPDE